MKTGKVDIDKLISENKRLQIELEKSNKELRSLKLRLDEVQEIGKIGSWEIDLKNKSINWNLACYALFGYVGKGSLPEEILNKHIHPEDKTRYWNTLKKSQNSNSNLIPEINFRIYDQDKKLSYLSLKGIYKLDENGEKIIAFGTYQDITTLKLNEADLYEKEQKLEKVIHASPVGIAIFDPTNKISHLNEKFEKLFGYTQEDLVKVDDWFPLAYPDKIYREKVTALWSKTIDDYFETGVFKPMEAIVTCKDGSRKVIEFSFQTIGEIYLTTFVDLTERKRAEEALIASENKYRHLFQNSRDPILLMDGNKYIDCNQAALDLLNMDSREEIIGKAPEDISPEYQPDGARSDEKARYLIADVLKKGYLRFEWLHLSSDNRAMYIEVSLTSITGQGSIYMYCIWRDITKQKEQANTIHLSKEKAETERNKFRTFIETLPVGVSLISPKGKILEVNSKSETILGLSKGSHKNSTIKSGTVKFIWEDSSPVPIEEYPASRVLSGEKLVQDVVMGICKEDDRITWVSVSAAAINENAGGGAAVVYEDITAKKLAEQELKESEEKYRSLIVALSEGVIMQAANGQVITANKSASKILGLKIEDLNGKYSAHAAWKKIHEDGTEFSVDEHPTMIALTTGKPVSNLVMGVYKPDGTLIWLLLHSEPIFKLKEKKPYAVVTSFTDITEQRNNQKTLQESEERFKKLSNLTIEGILIHDNRICIDANISFCNMFKCKLDDIVGVDILEKIFSAELAEEVSAQMSNNISNPLEIQAIKKNGKVFPVEIETHNIIWGNEPMHVSAIRDISERTKARRELEESELRFKTLTELTHEGIVIQNKGRIVDMNLSFQNMLGMTYAELHNKSVFSVLADEESVKLVKQKMKDEYLGSYEVSVIRKDKSIFPAEVFVRETSIKGKKVRVASIRDLTYYKETDEEIRKLSTAVIQSPVSIIVTSTEGIIEFVNPAFTVSTGYRLEEIVGKDASIFKSGATAIETYKDLWNTISAGKVWEGEFLNKKKDETLYWEKAVIAPVKDEKGNITNYLAIKEDITGLKKSEQRHNEMLSELERSNKDLEQFASVSSHDLQEPLRKIKNYTELLAGKYDGLLDEQGLNYMNIITRGTSRMQQLIDDLLSYSRVSSQAKHFKKVDVNEILSDVEDNLELAIFKAEAKVHRKELPTIEGDGSQLYLLFQNLISNALKFRSERLPIIVIDAKDDGDYTIIRVKDNGIGINKKYASKVFTVFQRLHSRDEYEGTGIGLAICKKIVDRHRGKIWLESNSGNGTSFFIRLPK